MDRPSADIPKTPPGEQQLRDFFAEDAFEPVEVSADDLVSVTMSARYQVTQVKVHESEPRAASTEALENAVAQAVNEAQREVALRNAKRLADFSSSRSPGARAQIDQRSDP